MARKEVHEDHVNHESWAIPYGDLVTLLLAFFVVMYSISSVNEGKYRVLSQAMALAFGGATKVLDPIQQGSQSTMSRPVSAMSTPQPAAPLSAPIARITLPITVRVQSLGGGGESARAGFVVAPDGSNKRPTFGTPTNGQRGDKKGSGSSNSKESASGAGSGGSSGDKKGSGLGINGLTGDGWRLNNNGKDAAGGALVGYRHGDKNAGAGAGGDAGDGQFRGDYKELKNIADEVEKLMSSLIDRQLVVVRRNESWLEVEIKTDILFPSGVATFSPQALPVLKQLSEILSPLSNQLRIEGYTDNVPINTVVFPSNWELSAARAATVARLFVERGMDPSRIAIMGLGEYRPATENNTSEGRNRNRRVLIVVFKNKGTSVASNLNSRQDTAGGTQQLKDNGTLEATLNKTAQNSSAENEKIDATKSSTATSIVKASESNKNK